VGHVQLGKPGFGFFAKMVGVCRLSLKQRDYGFTQQVLRGLMHRTAPFRRYTGKPQIVNWRTPALLPGGGQRHGTRRHRFAQPVPLARTSKGSGGMTAGIGITAQRDHDLRKPAEIERGKLMPPALLKP